MSEYGWGFADARAGPRRRSNFIRRNWAPLLAESASSALEETKRAVNLHLQRAISLVAPFALAAESESFSTEDIRKVIESFQKKD
ncbi:MAG: hypothetical protein VX466_05720 [Myxococcota bacterium]|nr:hypothetical protein [Myxococcota bacterium]